MQEASASNPPLSVPPRSATEALKGFPPEVHAAFGRYAAHGDLIAADAVVLAILQDQMSPRAAGNRPGSLGDHSTLVGDLGLDSVAILDAVFVVEDVFGVRIPNEDLPALRTVGDLRAYLRRRLAPSSAR